MVAVQSRMNGRLSELAGAFPAAWVSFGSGLAALSLLWLLPRFRLALRRVPVDLRSGRLRWWQLIGGIFGGLLVATQSAVVPIVGVAAFLVAVIGGQMVSALVVDRFGLGPGGRRRVTPTRLIAALLAVLGVMLIAGDGGAAAVAVVPVLLAFLAGVGVAMQQALNATLTVTSTRDALASSWVNFVMGSGLLLLIGAVPVVLAGPDVWGQLSAAPAWAWWGGLCGVTFIALAAWAVPHTGVLLFALVSITSQLASGLVLDLLDPRRPTPGAGLVAGLTLTVLAAALVAGAARRPPAATS